MPCPHGPHAHLHANVECIQDTYPTREEEEGARRRRRRSRTYPERVRAVSAEAILYLRIAIAALSSAVLGGANGAGASIPIGTVLICISIAIGQVNLDIVSIVVVSKQSSVPVLQLLFRLCHSCIGAISCMTP